MHTQNYIFTLLPTDVLYSSYVYRSLSNIIITLGRASAIYLCSTCVSRIISSVLDNCSNYYYH